MRYTVTSLAEIGTAFAGFAAYLEERATHAPQQHEREEEAVMNHSQPGGM